MAEPSNLLAHTHFIRGRAGRSTASDVRRLAEQAFRLRFDSLERMRGLAELAVNLSAGLPRTTRGMDARARAQAVLGNARRIAGEYPDARESLDEARRLWELGTRGHHLGALVAELRASLFEAMRCFDPAFGELDVATKHRLAVGLDLGKIHVKRGNIYCYSGEVFQALEAYEEAFQVARNRGIKRAALISAAFAFTEAGRWQGAQEILIQAEEILKNSPAGLHDKIRWAEARIADLQGVLPGAEKLYRDAQRRFVRAKQPQEAALVALDLALLLARQRRDLEALEIAREAGTLLSALGGQTEALAARLLCRITAERLAEGLAEAEALLFPLRTALRRRWALAEVSGVEPS